MNLPELILRKIESEHRGKEKAIKRKKLLEFARLFNIELKDRDLRKIYVLLPIVSCNVGIFWPIRKEEMEEFKSYLKSKAIPLFNRYKMVAEKHRDLMEDGDVIQWNLF